MKALVLISLISLLQGCTICGGVSRKDSEGWLSNFMEIGLAHNVCYHKPVDGLFLVSLLKKFYLNDDIRYLVLSHPDFPKRARVEYIAKNGVDDHFFANAIRSGAIDGEECRAYLKYLQGCWCSVSECAPLKEILLNMKGESDQFYFEVWREYKTKRERFPVWGYLPIISGLESVRKRGIYARQSELFDIVLANDSLPLGIKNEIARQLEVVDYRALCMRAIQGGSDSEWWKIRYTQVDEFVKEYLKDDVGVQ